MDANKDKVIAYAISLLGTREEIERIKKAFDNLKLILNQPKGELYRKALEWIVKNNSLRAEFIKYVQEEKAKVLEASKKNGSNNNS
jgi:hypothetical protein